MLQVEDLHVEFASQAGVFPVVEGLDFCIRRGEAVGLVGESGSGKTALSLAVMGLLEAPGRMRARRLTFQGKDFGINPRPAGFLGKKMTMVFQNPMGSLDPCYTVGFQIMEALRVHGARSRRMRRQRALELLREVEIPDPVSQLHAYPHQLSGGMSQRVMLAIALTGPPQLLIADEPTTALDVTVQAQILELLRKLQREHAMALLFITHDLAVVSQIAQRVIVLYAGSQVEGGAVPDLFDAPQHPYTRALLAALPERNRNRPRITVLLGTVPDARDRPVGCLFSPRCPFAKNRCRVERPLLTGQKGRLVRCHYPLDPMGVPTNGWSAAP